VIDDIRAGAESYAHYPTQYLFVIDREQRLVGVLRLRDLLLSARNARVDQIMIVPPLSVDHHANVETLDDFFERHSFLAVPVVDEQGRLLGVVTRSDFQEAWSEQAEEDFLKSQGLMEEELRSMPLWRRAKGRLIWLGANVFLNAIAASVIAMHQDTLSAVIALAVFLPIVSDMSGNAGFQAAAVSMRELALGVVRPEELWRVFCKEVSVGLLNGVVLGLLLGGLAWAWKGNPWLGLVAGGAMALNTVISVVIGGTMPLILRKFNKDPALASGPILTTLTDMAGFFLVLTFAAALLEKIQS
jgi:magnesium transporter